MSTVQGYMVRLQMSSLPSSKANKSITAEVVDLKKADRDAGTWSDRLFPVSSCGKDNAYTRLRRLICNLRRLHYENTHAWDDDIWRVLPAKRVDYYRQHIQQDGEEKFGELLLALIMDLPELVEKAKAGRRQAFRAEDYPDSEELHSLCKFEVSYRPMVDPTVLDKSLFSESIQEIEANARMRVAQSNQALVQRFLEPLELLGQQLADPSKRRMAPVLDTIRNTCDMVSQLDMAGNQELQEAAERIRVTFQEVTPDMIRKDDKLAELLKQEAQTAINTLRFAQPGARKFEEFTKPPLVIEE